MCLALYYAAINKSDFLECSYSWDMSFENHGFLTELSPEKYLLDLWLYTGISALHENLEVKILRNSVDSLLC